MRTARRPLLIALALAALAAVRIVVFALRDARPLYGGWEAADLQRSMFYHYGLRGHLDWGFWEQVGRDGFKPPLWYGGVPLLYWWKDSLRALDYQVLNAGCAFLLVLGCFVLGRRLGGELSGVLAAALCAFLPGIAWRLPMIGVEPMHAVLLLGCVLAVVRLVDAARGGGAALRWGMALGGIVGIGALMKWNFAAYAVAPVAVALVGMGGRGRKAAIGGVAVAVTVAAALFVPWALGVADLADVLNQGATGESDGAGLGFYAGELGRRSLGVVGWLAVVVAAAGVAFRERSEAGRLGSLEIPVVGAAVLGLWALHLFVPHNESRYLLPALPLLCVLLAVPMGWLPARVPGPWLWGGVVLVGLVTSWVMPWLGAVRDAAVLSEGELFAWDDVAPAPRLGDYGIGEVLSHPSLRARERTVVTTSLRGESYFPVLTFLNWELYGRNPNPVLSRSDWPDVTSKACAFDLERSTHFLSNRDLEIQEEGALRSMGFERVVTVTPWIQEVGTLQLWALEARSEPRYR